MGITKKKEVEVNEATTQMWSDKLMHDQDRKSQCESGWWWTCSRVKYIHPPGIQLIDRKGSSR